MIGAHHDDDNGSDNGSAYIFRFDGLTWVEEAKLAASDGGDSFGISVSLSGDYALIGALNDGVGSAYIFRFDGLTWVEDAKLAGSNVGGYGGWFGSSVSLSGDYALIGMPYNDENGTDAGAAYIFHFDGSTWTEQAKLRGGNDYLFFGIGVSLSGDRALIGAFWDDGNEVASGSAYIFRFDGSDWIEETKLTASDGATGDYFGSAVSLSDDRALIGARGDDDNESSSGSAYIFRFDGLTWVEEAKLTAPDAAQGDNFGETVSLSEEYALIGAPLHRGQDAGAAYIFHFDGSSWNEVIRLLASDRDGFDQFGRVSLSGDRALIGATYDDDNGLNSGSAYVFSGFVPSGDPLASFGICYGSTGAAEPTNPGALITIDPLTGAGTLVGPTGIIGEDGPAVRALAIKSTGEMYAMSNTASSDLYSVNASTGAGTYVANTGLLRPGDIVFDANDALYAVDETDILYTVDEVTGTRMVVGATGATLGGLAYDPTDGTMYGSGINDDIYTIDVTTGAATLVGTTGLGGNIPDIHFDQAGNLYGSKRGVGGIYDFIAIDKTTGAGTVIGSTGFAAVVGLATRLTPPPAIPCSEIVRFQSRCRRGGTIQARIILANTNHTGEVVWFTIDETLYAVSVDPNGRALLSIGIFSVGSHTVELADPPGCFAPLSVECPAGLAREGDFWDSDEIWEIPETTVLFDNYPNPFNPSTTIRYGLSENAHVTLGVFNILGQQVAALVSDEQDAGYHEVTFERGTLASGVYLYRIHAGDYVEVKKLVILK